VKREIRRQRREQEAQKEMMTHSNNPDLIWEQFAPLLEEGMSKLRGSERDALVLRFFQNMSLKEVGAALGVEERAAQKRVARSLEKLRDYFVRRGIASTTAIIANAISAHSVQAAPAAVAKSIMAAAVAKGAGAGASNLGLLKGALKIMAWTKMKTAVVMVSAMVLAAGTATPIIVYHHEHQDPLSYYASVTELTDEECAGYAKLSGMAPAKAAETLFDALQRRDAWEAGKFWMGDFAKDEHFMFKYYGGMKVISIGKPFKATSKKRDRKGRSINLHDVFVPYEVRLADGTLKKWHVALNWHDNHWYWDGGM
jgi:hypothetical protein